MAINSNISKFVLFAFEKEFNNNAAIADYDFLQ